MKSQNKILPDNLMQISFKMWCWRRVEKVGWTDRVKEKVREERNIVHAVN